MTSIFIFVAIMGTITYFVAGICMAQDTLHFRRRGKVYVIDDDFTVRYSFFQSLNFAWARLFRILIRLKIAFDKNGKNYYILIKTGFIFYRRLEYRGLISYDTKLDAMKVIEDYLRVQRCYGCSTTKLYYGVDYAKVKFKARRRNGNHDY